MLNVQPATFAKVTERQLIQQLLSREQAAVRAAFDLFLRDMRSTPVIRRVRELLEAGNLEAALNMAESYVVRLGTFVPEVFRRAAEASVQRLADRAVGRTSRIAVSFDPTNPRAIQLMRSNQLRFVREFSRAQRDATRTALVQAIRDGVGPAAAARTFRNSIGLTSYQLGMVDSYRTLLESSSRQALERALRDRRFDSILSEAVEGGDALTASQINRMVDRYHDQLLALRADTIARTETHRLFAQAQEEGLQEVMEQTGISAGEVRRVWLATHDKRTRDTHADMDGQEVGFNEPFVSPSGARLMYPGDPNAPANETINCRCVVTYVITPSPE